MHTLLYIIYKVCRKVNLLFQQGYISLKTSYYHHLSRKRFVFGSGFRAGKFFKISSDLAANQLETGKNLTARDHFRITMGHAGTLRIGERCFFNNNCSINCLSKIRIGNDCQFGENVSLYDHNHRHEDHQKLISAQGYATGSINIGNNCWIGSNVVILKDVHIGDNVIIGAGCVIHKSVEPNSVVFNQQNLQTRRIF